MSGISVCEAGDIWPTSVSNDLQEQLTKQQQNHAKEAGSKAQLADLDGQIEAAEQRILSAKKSVLENDMTIQKLLRMSVGA